MRSKDDGATFSAEEPAFERPTGACGCCGTRALAARDGTLYLLYRAATAGRRSRYVPAQLRRSRRPFPRRVDPSLAGRGLPDEQRIAGRAGRRPRRAGGLGDPGPGVFQPDRSADAPGRAADRPARAVSAIASTPPSPATPGARRMLVWTEGTGWQKGGSLAWQLFDRDGRPGGMSGRIKDGVPVWGLAAVVALPDGGFAIIRSRVPTVRVTIRPRRGFPAGTGDVHLPSPRRAARSNSSTRRRTSRKRPTPPTSSSASTPRPPGSGRGLRRAIPARGLRPQAPRARASSTARRLVSVRWRDPDGDLG